MIEAEFKKVAEPLTDEIINLIKSRLDDDFPVGSFTLHIGWRFYLASLDTLLQVGQIEDLKHEIELMRAELIKLENRIQ